MLILLLIQGCLSGKATSNPYQSLIIEDHQLERVSKRVNLYDNVPVFSYGYVRQILEQQYSINQSACSLQLSQPIFETGNWTYLLESEDDVIIKYTKLLIDLIRQDEQALILSMKGIVYVYDFKIQSIEQKKLSDVDSYGEYQYGSYDPYNKFTYLVYERKIVYFKQIDAIQIIDNTIQNIILVYCVKGYLYIVTDNKIIAYTQKENGDLSYYGPILTLEGIKDVVLGGEKGNQLYVLYSEGVKVYDISNPISIVFNEKLGLIPFSRGYKLDQSNDDTLIVLEEKRNGRTHAVDASINLDTGTWFFVSGRQFPHKIIDVDLADDIAIFQGAESHNVLFYTIYTVLNRNIQDAFQLYIPNTVSMDFYEPQYGEKDLQNHWYKGQIKTFLYGITDEWFFIKPWQITTPTMMCFSDDPKKVGEVVKFNLTVNTTDCKEKETKTYDQNLVICRFQTEYTITFYYDDQEKINLLQYLIIGLGLVLVLVIIIACYIYHKKKQYFVEMIAKLNRLRTDPFQTQPASSKDHEKLNVEES